MNRLIVLVLAAFAVSTAAPAQTASPYAGQEQRSIKALSDEEVRDLLQARGMGLAKAAELNSYPGPLHALELAAQLGLSDAQRTSTEALFAKMRDEALPLGAQIVEAERGLDGAFAEGKIDSAELRTRVNAIAALQGKLRAVHLATHIAQRALFTPEQIARYDTLRGYRSASSGHQQKHGH